MVMGIVPVGVAKFVNTSLALLRTTKSKAFIEQQYCSQKVKVMKGDVKASSHVFLQRLYRNNGFSKLFDHDRTMNTTIKILNKN